MATSKQKKLVVDMSSGSLVILFFADAAGALLTLLNLMVLPAVLLIVFGIYKWRYGWLYQIENTTRLGRMLLMFGAILLVIVMIATYFLEKMQAQKLAMV